MSVIGRSFTADTSVGTVDLTVMGYAPVASDSLLISANNLATLS